jgi:hypothetical protein
MVILFPGASEDVWRVARGLTAVAGDGTLGDTRKMDGFCRLDQLTRAVEQDRDPFVDFGAALARERKISSSLAGRTVFDERESEKPAIESLQLDLF